ncbi:hypothetical protein [Tenacibaculum xiamenense]|uniref:hypothetical protein n=1 Tax=Tenacibaculum xiamenense TaxID=1261553 RepID=UPI0038961D90
MYTTIITRNKIFIWVLAFLCTSIVNSQDLTTSSCNSQRIYEVKATDISEDSAFLSWISIANSREFEIIYGLKGFSLTNSKEIVERITISSPVLFISGLSANTAYDFYVKLKCQDDIYRKKISITTLASTKSTLQTRSFSTATASTSTLEEEKQALWDLYQSTNGPQWNNTIANNKAWSLSKPISEWYGVLLRDGHVDRLLLQNNNLDGVIPPSIGKLSKIYHLWLSKNKIRSIPTEIGQLKGLKQILLDENQLETIPSGIGGLENLYSLYLYKNKITSLPTEIGQLANLKSLGLGKNLLNTLPQSMTSLTKMEAITIFDNSFSTFPSIFSHPNWKSLVSIGASGNMIKVLPVEMITNLENLTSINIENNIIEVLPNEIGGIRGLNVLMFSNNRVSDLPSAITNARNFAWASCANNKLAFHDIERILSAGMPITAPYSPQAKVDLVETKTVPLDGSITLSTSKLTSTNNSYQWYKDGVAILGATSKDLVLNNVKELDAGVYHFTATNSVVTGLTLEREPITVNISQGPVTPVPLSAVESTKSGSFRPIYEKKYMISGWVKEKSLTHIKSSSYRNSYIQLYTIGLVSGSLLTPEHIGDYYPTGHIIDGWQRIEGVFTIKSFSHSDVTAVNNLVVELKNTSSDITSYFDDIRIYPFNGSMKSFVYDDDTKKLMAELDENNFATYYEYDSEGGLIRVKKETERGVYTIQETRSSNAKKQ